MDRSAGDNNINNEDQGKNNTTQSHWTQQHHLPHRTNPRRVQQSQTQQQTHQQQPPPPPPHQQPPCPRCSSTDTKFGYYNNYNLTQPRYFCKGCKRYWTHGGALRNVPVGGGSRKTAKRPKLSPANTTQPSPSQQVSPPPPHELSRFGVSVSNPLVINPAKVLEIGEGSALSLPITTALSVSPPLPTSSPSSLQASPLMINYLNPNYPHLPQGEDRHHGFFTSLIGFQGMNAAGATSQPFFTPVSRGSGGFESAATPSMNNLGPLFHFSPFLTQEPPGWHRQSFVTAGAGEVHHQVFNQLPGVPVTSVDGPMFCRTSADRRHDDGAVEVKDDDANRGGRSSEKVTDQQPDTSNYGRDGNQ